MKKLPLQSKTILMIIVMTLISQTASAGIIGDAMATSQAKWFIIFLFGALGATLGGTMLTDFINSQEIQKPIPKIVGIGLCILGIVKTNTITSAFANF